MYRDYVSYENNLLYYTQYLKGMFTCQCKNMFFEQKSFSYVVIFYFKEETVLFYNKQNKS